MIIVLRSVRPRGAPRTATALLRSLGPWLAVHCRARCPFGRLAAELGFTVAPRPTAWLPHRSNAWVVIADRVAAALCADGKVRSRNRQFACRAGACRYCCCCLRSACDCCTVVFVVSGCKLATRLSARHLRWWSANEFGSPVLYGARSALTNDSTWRS